MEEPQHDPFRPCRRCGRRVGRGRPRQPSYLLWRPTGIGRAADGSITAFVGLAIACSTEAIHAMAPTPLRPMSVADRLDPGSSTSRGVSSTDGRMKATISQRHPGHQWHDSRLEPHRVAGRWHRAAESARDTTAGLAVEWSREGRIAVARDCIDPAAYEVDMRVQRHRNRYRRRAATARVLASAARRGRRRPATVETVRLWRIPAVSRFPRSPAASRPVGSASLRHQGRITTTSMGSWRPRTSRLRRSSPSTLELGGIGCRDA